MIEHFLKWLELVPLLDHNNEGIAYAFLNKVLNRFGVLIKIFLPKVWNFVKSSKSCVIKH
jgi:hypothetical protein